MSPAGKGVYLIGALAFAGIAVFGSLSNFTLFVPIGLCAAAALEPSGLKRSGATGCSRRTRDPRGWLPLFD